MMMRSTTLMPVALVAALLFVTTNISVVYSSGYVSDACSELCSKDGNRGNSKLPSGDHLWLKFEKYDTGSAVDIANKIKYGEDVNCWDISERTSLDHAFVGASDFNSRLDCWDTSRVTSMKSMFNQAFNQDIGNWNTSAVEDFSYIFSTAKYFNQDISNWDTSRVTSMRAMFRGNTKFNQDIGMWDVSGVTNFHEMFFFATTFNQDISNWDLSAGENIQNMLTHAKAFNQNLCDWRPLQATSSSTMFANSGCEVKRWSEVKNLNVDNAVCQFCPRTIGKWELQAVGEDSIKGKPSSTVQPSDGDEPFTVRTFFETNENLFSTTDFDNTYTVEVYTGVDAEQDDCSTGTLLGNEGTFIITKTVSNVEFPYNQEFKDIGGKLFPQFTEGKVGEAIVTLSDPLYVSIYTADDGNDDFDGTVEFCVRITITADSGRETSHIDSKKKIKIDLTANIAVQDVDIEKIDTQEFEKTVSKEVAVVSFVCNNKNEPVQDGRSFSLGQNFRVCVGPTEGGIESGYLVDGYNELSCGGIPLVTNKVATDVLTTIASSNVNDRLAVQSVLTPDFAIGESVVCEGTVSLSFKAPGATRYLAPSIQSATFSGSGVEEEPFEGLFKMNVKMNVPVKMNIPSIESSASSPLTSSVAIIGFGSVLSFVVSLLM